MPDLGVSLRESSRMAPPWTVSGQSETPSPKEGGGEAGGF
jgi:hypothetical protein